ncbi:MAG: sulfotransferase domain-containing protein [Pirellulales bacterium]
MNPSVNWQPTFIGIGAQKCATTWCWHALKTHPNICMAQPKELDFFNNNYHRGMKWYQEHFSSPDSPVRGEISPLYLYDTAVVNRISMHCPKARILVLLRNPYERAISNLLHDIRDMDGGIASTAKNRAWQIVQRDDKYIERSCYAQALKPYFDTMPRAQIKVLYYEDLINNSRNFLENLFTAVGANPYYSPHDIPKAANRTQDYRSLILYKAIREISQLVKSRPQSRRWMEWIYANTLWRERILSWLTVDRGRPQWDFNMIFGAAAKDRISSDMQQLQVDMSLAIPESWHHSSHDVAERTHAA